MAHLVNPYWSRFAPMDPTMSNILGLFTLVILIISCCGNGVVVYIFGGTKSLRTPANLFGARTMCAKRARKLRGEWMTVVEVGSCLTYFILKSVAASRNHKSMP